MDVAYIVMNELERLSNQKGIEKLSNQFVHTIMMSIAGKGLYTHSAEYHELYEQSCHYKTTEVILKMYGSWERRYSSHESYSFVLNAQGESLAKEVSQEMFIRRAERNLWNI